jgi:hypothetical protein
VAESKIDRRQREGLRKVIAVIEGKERVGDIGEHLRVAILVFG